MHSLGTELAAELHARLADLRAARNVGDLVAGHPKSDAEDEAVLTIDVGSRHQLVCHAGHYDTARSTGGSIEWQSVRRIRLDDLRSVD